MAVPETCLLQGYGLVAGPAAKSDAGSYRIRTILNAAQADGTIIFGSVDPLRDKGSYLTLKLAEWYVASQGKTYCHVTVDDLKPENMQATAAAIRGWIMDEDVRILNVAGNRQFKVKQLDLAEAVAQCLSQALETPVRENGAVAFNCQHPDYVDVRSFTRGGVAVELRLAGDTEAEAELARSDNPLVQQLCEAGQQIDPGLKTAHYQMLIDSSPQFEAVEDYRLFEAIGALINRTVARLEPQGFKQAVFTVQRLDDSPGWVAEALAEQCQKLRTQLDAAGISMALKVGRFEVPAGSHHVPITVGITTMRDPNVVAALNKARHPSIGHYGIVYDALLPPGQAYSTFNEPEPQQGQGKGNATRGKGGAASSSKRVMQAER